MMDPAAVGTATLEELCRELEDGLIIVDYSRPAHPANPRSWLSELVAVSLSSINRCTWTFPTVCHKAWWKLGLNAALRQSG